MSPLTIKRLVVVVISQLIGFVLGFLIITLGFDALPLISSIQTPQGVSIAEYGNLYFLATAIPLGIIVMIWMDAILDTKILPD
jgi:hypothetical protein